MVADKCRRIDAIHRLTTRRQQRVVKHLDGRKGKKKKKRKAEGEDGDEEENRGKQQQSQEPQEQQHDSTMSTENP